jgi:hypothetical protein
MSDVRSVARRDANVILVHKVVHAMDLVVEGEVWVILVAGEILDVELRTLFGILWRLPSSMNNPIKKPEYANASRVHQAIAPTYSTQHCYQQPNTSKLSPLLTCGGPH